MRKHLAFVFGFLLLTMGPNGYAATQQTDSKTAVATYTQGVQAFQHGDYHAALKAFLQARAKGYHDAKLTYSLGVTYYRLGRYAEATHEFKRLLSDPKLAALCHYNLGRIAEAQQNPTTALHEYRLTYAQAQQPSLKALADSQIRRLTGKHTPPLRGFGYANVTTGYDDNVALAPQNSTVTQSSGAGSPLMTVLLGGGYQLNGTYDNGIMLFANFYNTDYFHLSRYDESMISVGGQLRRTHGKWAWQAGLFGSHTTVGGSGFETLGSLRFNAQRTLNARNTLAGGYYYDRISGQSTYQYLGGSQQRIFIEDKLHDPLYNLTYGFQHAINNRKDFSTTNPIQFLSASPTRNRLYAKFELFPERTLSWQAGFDYQKSHYTPANFPVNGGYKNRDDTLYIWQMGAKYKLMPHWNLKAQYRHLDNKSNIANYAYKSNLYTLSLHYLFY